MFKLSEVLRVNEDNEITGTVHFHRIIPYEMWVELAAQLGCLPSEEQQTQFYRQRTGIEPTKGED